MHITYMRSSSAGAWDFCQQRYYIEYVLGIKGKSPNNKAEKGNVVHKAFEILALKKLAIQNGDSFIQDAETKLEVNINDVTPDFALDIAYKYYVNCSEFVWVDKDFKDCKKWMWDTLNFHNGEYSPLNRNVMLPEQYFDFEIDEPWAKYSFPDFGISGNLRIKGTIDLVTELEPGIIEYIDWKTGKRYDWAKNVEKDYRKLYDDFQLLLYLYALSRLYPKHDHIFVTIFFCQDGGPFSICFERHHQQVFLDKLREKFERIKECLRPSRIINDSQNKWKCKSLCSHYKNKWEGSDKNICDFVHEETIKIGLDRVTKKYSNQNNISNYGSGGGQSSRNS